MPRPPRRIAGFTLIELLLVIAVLGILLGVAMPSSNPSLHHQLQSAASILRTDLAYGRSLAVSNNSNYRVAFDPANNRCVLEHSNTDAAFASLDTLPDSQFRDPADPPTQHIVDLADSPRMGSAARLLGATAGDPPESVTGVEFGPLGQTTRTAETKIWLAAGQGSEVRYLCLRINPATGLTSIGEYTSTEPPAVNSED